MLEEGGWAGQGQRSDRPEERSDVGQETIRTPARPVKAAPWTEAPYIYHLSKR